MLEQQGKGARDRAGGGGRNPIAQPGTHFDPSKVGAKGPSIGYTLEKGPSGGGAMANALKGGGHVSTARGTEWGGRRHSHKNGGRYSGAARVDRQRGRTNGGQKGAARVKELPPKTLQNQGQNSSARLRRRNTQENRRLEASRDGKGNRGQICMPGKKKRAGGQGPIDNNTTQRIRRRKKKAERLLVGPREEGQKQTKRKTEGSRQKRIMALRAAFGWGSAKGWPKKIKTTPKRRRKAKMAAYTFKRSPWPLEKRENSKGKTGGAKQIHGSEIGPTLGGAKQKPGLP